MNSLLILGAHMIGDFGLQTDYMALHKLTSPRVRTLHVACYCIPFLLLTVWWCFGMPHAPNSRPFLRGGLFLLTVAVTHWLTDSRLWASGEKWPPKPILVDQTIHIATLGILEVLFLTDPISID
jgi:Protein of unknown function (DUF3307)